MKRVLVNINSVANTKEIREEVRNGRKVIIVPSATLPDNIVMNSIRYPAAEIAKSYKGLERTPAPYGHPMINGKFVSARDPEGINAAYIGAWNENVRQEGGRVLLDKVIDVEVANQSEKGKEVLTAINEKKPIHTSTGLYCNLDAGDDDAKHTAKDLYFDHDAILLNEEGAATPEQGVGIFVNSKGENEEIEVVNSILHDIERELDKSANADTKPIEVNKTLYDKMKAFFEAFTTNEDEEKEPEMAISDEDFKKLSDTVEALSNGFKGVGEQIAEAVTNAVKPLTDNLAELKANQEAKDKAELDGLKAKILKANILDEKSVDDLTLTVARKLAEKAEPGKAAAFNSARGNGADADEWADYDMNANLDKKDGANA